MRVALAVVTSVLFAMPIQAQSLPEQSDAVTVYSLADFVTHNCANVSINKRRMSVFLESHDLSMENIGQTHFGEIMENVDRAQILLDRNPNSFCKFMVMFFGVKGIFPGLIEIAD